MGKLGHGPIFNKSVTVEGALSPHLVKHVCIKSSNFYVKNGRLVYELV